LTKKPRKLSHELLGLIGISALVALILYLLLSQTAAAIAEDYCFQNDIVMTEFDWMEVDRVIFLTSAILSCLSFTVVFLNLLQDRMVYIRKITNAIGVLQEKQETVSIPLEGNNELTVLAHAINQMSAARQQLREKEAALRQEKDQLIRTLSHDIRTPLTSVLAYSDYLTEHPDLPPEDRDAYLQLIQKKSQQIRELTDILLEGGKRAPEYMEDAHLFMEQIAAEFQYELEDSFPVTLDLTGLPAFSGSFDVQELRRVFDNLSSNIQKYADPTKPVTLSITLQNGALHIRQSNWVLPQEAPSEGFQIGLQSIRRIAQLYGGTVTVEPSPRQFSICISLSEF